MVQTADARQRQQRARWDGVRLNPADGRCLFMEPNMRSVFMVIGNVLTAQPQQMSLMERNDMIQHLSAAAAHPSLGDSVLPGTPDARPNRLDPARLQKLTHLAAEFGVAVE
jgi:hypothetical protein